MYMHTLTYIMQPDQSILSVKSVKVAQSEFTHQVHKPWVSAQQTVRMQIVIAVAIAGEHMAGNALGGRHAAAEEFRHLMLSQQLLQPLLVLCCQRP